MVGKGNEAFYQECSRFDWKCLTITQFGEAASHWQDMQQRTHAVAGHEGCLPFRLPRLPTLERKEYAREHNIDLYL